ncbi:MAG: hypothetical protein KAT35_04500, partial [Candidatus Aenigmarchaeota archaeon]|nr:hypothetical protein [Candidatus Aenigmarchaeota archaeon]
TNFRSESRQIKELADEMIGVLNKSKKEIEEQMGLAHKGIEKYESIVVKREEVAKIREAIDEMEAGRDRLVRQLRLLSKSVSAIQVSAEVSGRTEKVVEIKKGITEVKIAEKAYDVKRTHLQKMIKKLMVEEKERKMKEK